MKRTYNILTAVALLAFAPIAYAQTIEEVCGELEFPQQKDAKVEGGVGFNKSVSSPTSNGTYWIKLEAFATGHATQIVSSTPSDIILVLDSSTSMVQEDYGTAGDEYKALPIRDYTYNTFSNTNSYGESFYGGVSNNVTQLYYLYEGEYYVVSRGGNAQNTSRYLSFSTGSSTYYLNNGLNGGQPSTTAPNRNVGPTNNNNTIWTGVLYTKRQLARIDALKNAVNEFIDNIYQNDHDVTAIDPSYSGNRIAIVTYDANAYKLTSNYSWETADAQRANWFDIGASGVRENLKNAVLNIALHNYTRPELGLREAIDDLLDGSPATKRENANLTVVMFTDGVPAQSSTGGNGNNFDAGVANNAIYYGHDLKQTYEASLFSIGLLDKNSTNEHVKRGIHFLDLLSSNYPNANIAQGSTAAWTVSGNTVTVSGMTGAGEDDKDSDVFFQLVDENTDLSSIFDAIAQQSGGSADASLSSATSTVDIVSSSFMLPENATSSDIKLFTAQCTFADEDAGTYEFGTEIQAKNRTDTYHIYDDDGIMVEIDGQTAFDVDDDMEVSLGKDANDNDKITVEGFDYSNLWCGPLVDQDGDVTYHGYKVIIMIPIKMNPDAVGGPNVPTNAEGSGIYIDPNDTEPHVTFDSPTISLPVNMYIEKIGLNPGESAKFMIERAIIPDEDDWTVEDLTGWKFVSTVFVTNSPNAKTSAEGNPMVKVRGMPATITIDENNDGNPDVDSDGKIIQKPVIYRIVEENWAWSYELDSETENPQYTVTSKVDNPFTFANAKRENGDIDVMIRNAESKATNIFKTVGEGKTNEVYDDSKDNGR